MKLIDKSALVAEIEKRFDYRVNGLKAINNGTFWKEEQSEDEFNAVLTRCAYNAAKNEVFELMCFLDTLEVRKVDLKKEFSQWWKSERAKDYNVDILYERYSNVSMKLAKHFFELGIKAQKGEEV